MAVWRSDVEPDERAQFALRLDDALPKTTAIVGALPTSARTLQSNSPSQANAGEASASDLLTPDQPVLAIRGRFQGFALPGALRGVAPRHLPAFVVTAAMASMSALLATERDRRVGFLLAPCLLGGGAAWYFSLLQEPRLSAIVLGLAALALARFFARGRVLLAPLLAAAMLFVGGMGVAKLRMVALSTPMVGAQVASTITGRVERVEARGPGSHRLTITLLETARPTLRHAPARLRLSTRALPAGLRPGDGIQGRALLRPPSGPTQPGGYDFAFHAWFDGIGANGFFLGAPRRVALSAPASFATRAAEALQDFRTGLATHIATVAPGASGAVSAALITGERAAIPEEVNEALRVTGLAHVLSISGLHMALAAATIMAALRALMSAFPVWASRVPTRKIAAAAAFVAVTVYLFMAGAEVATRRSYIMLAVMLLALLADRAAITMRNLAIAALVVIALTPEEIAGPGFQMSFAATAALIAGHGWWTRRREARASPQHSNSGTVSRILRSAAAFMAGLAATSILAGVATGIYGVWHFQRAAPMGLPANLLAMPIVTLVVMPSAVFAVVMMPFGLEEWPLRIMAWGVQRMIEIAEWLAARGPAGETGAIPHGAALLMTAALIVATVLTTRLRLLALPLASAGLWLATSADRPLLLVSEDGRQVGLLVEKENSDGSQESALHLNRNRPNGFTLQNWMRASGADYWLLPKAGNDMRCDGAICEIDGNAGPIRWTGTLLRPEQWGEFCADSALAIFAYAPARRCPGDTVTVTSSDLARFGAVEIFGAPDGYRVRHALSSLERPWRDHRRYSRAARNRAPDRNFRQHGQ